MVIGHDRPKKRIQGISNCTGYQGQAPYVWLVSVYSLWPVFCDSRKKKILGIFKISQNCFIIDHGTKLNIGLKRSYLCKISS